MWEDAELFLFFFKSIQRCIMILYYLRGVSEIT